MAGLSARVDAWGLGFVLVCLNGSVQEKAGNRPMQRCVHVGQRRYTYKQIAHKMYASMRPLESSAPVRLSVRQRIEQHCNHAEVAVGRKNLHPNSPNTF